MLRVNKFGREGQEVAHRMPRSALAQTRCAFGKNVKPLGAKQVWHLLASTHCNFFRTQQGLCR